MEKIDVYLYDDDGSFNKELINFTHVAAVLESDALLCAKVGFSDTPTSTEIDLMSALGFMVVVVPGNIL